MTLSLYHDLLLIRTVEFVNKGFDLASARELARFDLRHLEPPSAEDRECQKDMKEVREWEAFR